MAVITAPILDPSKAPTARRLTSRVACATVLGCAALLAGCASVRTIESQVQSYSSLQQRPAPATYRLQLLPSQQANSAFFTQVVQQAEQSLAGVGLQRDDANGHLVAQINAQSRYIPDSWLRPGSPYNSFGWGMGYGRGFGWGGGMMWRDTGPNLHYRAVQLTLRDFSSQQVVYETSATYEDVWVDEQVIYRILFDSALNGFPQPPTGPRTVRATIGQAQAPAVSTPATGAAPTPAPSPKAIP